MADLILQNTAEGGTDATAVTTANSGGASGDAFSSMGGSTTQITFEQDAAKSGSLGYRITLDGTARYLRGDDPSPSGRGGMSAWFYVNGLAPGGALWFGQIRTAADVNICSVVLYTDGKIYAYLNNTRQTASGSASALTAGWYRYDLKYTPGASTTTGRIEFQVYDASGTQVANWDSGATLTTSDTNPGARYRFGMSSAATNYTVVDLDNLRWGHVASGEIGDVANAAPTLSLTANQNVAASASVSVTATASDSDGSIASYAWTLVSGSSTGAPSLTGASTATVSFTAGAAGNLYTLQCVVTDNGGATATATTEVRVPVSSGTSIRHLTLDGTGAGTWTKAGGSSTDGAALSDESDSTYVESSALSSTEQTRRVRLQPSVSRTGLQLQEKVYLDSSASPTVKFRLYEGTTLRQEWTQAVTTTNTEYTLTVSSPGSITDWGNLYVELSAVL